MRDQSFLSLGPHGFHRVAYREWGEARVRGLLRRVLSRTGRLRVSVRELHQIGGDDA